MAGSVQQGACSSRLRWEEPREAHALVTSGRPQPGCPVGREEPGGHAGLDDRIVSYRDRLQVSEGNPGAATGDT